MPTWGFLFASTTLTECTWGYGTCAANGRGGLIIHREREAGNDAHDKVIGHLWSTKEQPSSSEHGPHRPMTSTVRFSRLRE